MSRPCRWAFSEGKKIWLLAASLLLLGVVLPAQVSAAPDDESGRVVPTRIHDRARSEGAVRVIVELALPSGRMAESVLPNQAKAAFRREIATAAARVLSRLTQHPH